jgi:flavin-binding protein dodecin
VGRHRAAKGESGMSIHKIIEISSQSEKSWEDAAHKAVADAARTVKNIKTIYVEGFQGIVEGDRIVAYRVNAKVTFEVRD